MMRKDTITVVAIIVLGFLVGCASQSSNVKEAQSLAPSSAKAPAPYVIHAGDQLDIKFFFNPELNESVVVRPDGKISLQLIDEIQAAGLKPDIAPCSREDHIEFGWVALEDLAESSLEPAPLRALLSAWLDAAPGPPVWASTY